jgi:hypothetical protein
MAFNFDDLPLEDDFAKKPFDFNSLPMEEPTGPQPSVMATSNMQTDKEEIKSPIDQAIEGAQAFEQTKMGKILGFPRRITGQGKLSDELKRQKEIESLDLPNQLKESLRDVTIQTAKAAPIMIGGAGLTSGKAASAASKLLMQSLKNAAISGSAAGIEEVAKKASVKKALKEGAQAGALSGGLTIAIPGLAKGIKVTGKQLTKMFSGLKGYTLERAIKNPRIMEGNAPSVFDAGNKAKEFIDDYAIVVKDRFNEGLNALKVPAGKQIDTSKIAKKISRLGLDKSQLKSKLITAARREAVPVSDDLANRFVNGKKIGFHEARKMNSLLFDITKSKETEAIGRGLVGKLDSIKKDLLSSMGKSVPGIRNVNRQFAVDTKKLQFLNKTFGDPAKNENAVRSFAKQLAGDVKSKEAGVRYLRDIPNSKKIEDILLDSVAAEEFSKVGTDKLMNLVRLGLGTGVGGTVAGAPGAAAGAILSTEAGLRGAIKTGLATQAGAEKIAPIVTGPIARKAGFSGRQLIGRREE